MSHDARSNAYLTTRVMTASPVELRLMLIEGAIKFLRQGRDGLATKDFEACFNGYSRGRAIISELMTTMRPDPDRELYGRMQSLYAYMMSRLIESSHEKDPAKADEVIQLLEYDRETWMMLIEKLRTEDRGPGPASPALAQTGGRGDPADHTPLSLEG
jgi:flagellar protein FliS